MSRVLVLAGGLSPERDVSIRSGRRVADALRHVGLEVAERDIDAGLLGALVQDPPRCVIPLLHGAAGEDGALRDVLEALRLPYVGSGPQGCRLAFDKPVAKTLLGRAGLATPAAVALPHSTFRELGAPGVLAAIIDHLGLPVVVKPTRGGSALGTAIVRDPAELPAAMVGAFAYGDTTMVERYVAGTEVAVCVLDGPGGPRTLPAVEIAPDGDFYDFTARYTAGTTEFFVPARLDDDVAAAVARVAIDAHVALGLRHWSRADLIVDAAGVPWLLEVNAAPGMTETSLFPQAIAAAGEDLGRVIADLVDQATGA